MRNKFLAAIAIASVVVPATAVIVSSATAQHAAKIQPFSQAAFAAAQKAGAPILIDVYAPWCPVCRAQAPTINQIANDPSSAKLVIFRIDFDTQKAEQRALRVTGQSTLIAFKGARETGRLRGDTDPARIAALVATTR